jgi:hypothetical protein
LFAHTLFSAAENDCARFRGHSVSTFSGDLSELDFHPHSLITIELLFLSGLFLGLLLGFRHESSPVTS